MTTVRATSRHITVRGMVYWRCPGCGRYKPSTGYTEQASRANGLRRLCRLCDVPDAPQRPKRSKPRRSMTQIRTDARARGFAMWLLRSSGAKYEQIAAAFEVSVSRASEMVKAAARRIARSIATPPTETPVDPPWLRRLRAAGAIPLLPISARDRLELERAIAEDLRKRETNEP